MRGIVFAGTATADRAPMSAFVGDVLGMDPVDVDGIEADAFGLADGSVFVVASPDGVGSTQRTLGFLVDDLEQAATSLLAAGVEVDAAISTNARFRYLHFRAPDGCLYELVERLAPS